MEKIVSASSIQDENEKIIANILHDIKSPLYSIKLGLQSKLDNELNLDVFETVLGIIEYIENFLVNYSFKLGKFKNKIEAIDIKNLITQKIEDYKYLFIEKNIHIDIIQNNKEYTTFQIPIFLSSIIGNIVSNIAFHANNKNNAQIILNKYKDDIFIEFINSYDSKTDNFQMGLEFCKKLMCETKTQMTFCKTKNEVNVKLKIPKLKEN